MEKQIQITGIKPFLHQADVITALKQARGTGLTVVVNSSRQKGKSYLDSNLLLYFSCNYENTNNFYVSPTLKQAKAIYKFIIDGILHTGIVKSRNATDLIITLINGSTIYFKSAEQRDALRGFTADFLIIDEAAFIPDDIFYLILPWTDAKQAPMLITSTPWIKDGFFYKYFIYGKEKSHNCLTVDWSEEKYRKSIEQILPPERLEEYRQTLPKNVFETDYLGHFLDDEGVVFTGLNAQTKYTELQPTDRLYVGIDWSNQGENDDTVISVFNQNGEQVYLKYFNKLSPLRQIDLICKELEPYGNQIAVISCETNSIGTPYTDLLKDKSQILTQKVQGWNTSNSSKNSLVVNFQAALENGTVWLLPDEKQKAQFGYFTANYNPKTRNVSYAAPQGLNDDCVMATLIAYEAYRSGAMTGNYVIRFAGTNRIKRR